MLYESDVVAAVCVYLRSRGYEIEQQLNESQQGDDIIALSPADGTRVFIEAKGETSSKAGSNRFGKPFTRSQVRDHVANAFFRSAQMLADGKVRVGIALPKNRNHLDYVARIAHALSALKIEVYWVDATRQVRSVENWK